MNLSPFPLHFLIHSPFSRSPAASLQQVVQPWLLFWIISQLLCGRCSLDEVVIVDIKGCYLLPGNCCAGIGGVKVCMWLWFVFVEMLIVRNMLQELSR